MAFVHRAPRRTITQPSPTTTALVGPGTYYNEEHHSPTNKLKLSYAPFSSSSERGIDDRYASYDHTSNVGPGSYEKPSTLGGPAISTAFVSAVPRFTKDDPHQLPGPGAYTHVTPWTKPPRTKAHGVQQRKGGVEWVRVSAPPSIPAPTQSYGYEENEAGELILQQPNRSIGHTGRPNDIAGPGDCLAPHHEHILAHSRKIGFAEWSKSRTHRAGELQLRRAASQPGPGYYLNTDRPETQPRRRGGKKVSPFFASKVDRLKTASVNLLAQTTVPGPGSYSASSDFDRIASSFVPEQYQFFGSKTGRLIGGILQNAAVATPGPGSYKSKSSLKVIDPSTRDPTAPMPAFTSTSNRFHTKSASEPDLGPGAYLELPNTSAELAKKVFGRNTSFGTTEQRFVKKTNAKSSDDAHLGPATYEPRNTGAIRVGRKPLSVFVSTTKRFDAASGKSAQEEKQAVERANQASASYLDSKPIGIGNEPTWGNHSKATALSSSFATKQSRFDHRANGNAQLGPGSYSVNSTNLYRSAPSVSSSFKTIDRNAPSGGSVYKKDTNAPGPGYYEPNASSFVTRSFNITIANDV